MFPIEEEQKRRSVEVAVLLVVPLLLAAIHLLTPESLKQSLSFSHDRFAIYTLLTAAYVHSGQPHLLGNIFAYLLAAVYAYMLCVAVDERRWFWRTFVVFLVGLPVLVSLLSYVVFSTWFPEASPVSRGFSGVVAGFGGFLLVAVAVHLRATYSRETVFFVGQFAVLLLLGELLWIYAPRIGLVEGGAVAVGLALAVSGIVSRGRRTAYGDAHYRQVGQDLLYVGLVLALLVWLVYGLFPADPVSQGTFTNVFAHGAGFLEGGLLAALTYVVVE